MRTLGRRFSYFILGLSLILLSDTCLFAQQYLFTHYTRDRHLPGNQMWGVMQDSKGYMWFATSAGLIKYNGKTYKNFGKGEGLFDNWPLDLCEDKEGSIWVSYDKGISRIKKDKVKNWTISSSENHLRLYPDQYGRVWTYGSFFSEDIYFLVKDSLHNFSQEYNLKNQIIANICEDHNGGIFLVTQRGDIYRFLANKLDKIVINGIQDSKIQFAFFDAEDDFIICSLKGISLIPSSEFYSNPEAKWILNRLIFFGMENKMGKIWATSENGIYILRRSGNSLIVEKNLTKNNGLLSNNVFRVFEDAEENMWIAYSEKGVSKISSLMFCNYGESEGFNGDLVTVVSKTDNDFFIASVRGLYRFANNRFEPFLPDNKYSKYWFTSIVQDKAETLLGTSPGIYNISGGSFKFIGLPQKIIRVFMKDHEGKLWVGTHDGLFVREGENSFIEKNYSLASKSINDLLEANNKDLLVATDGGLFIIQGGTLNTGEIKIINPEGILTQDITDIAVDSNGNIIIALEKGVIVKTKTNKILTIDELKNIEIAVLFMDSSGRLWAGSASDGIYLLTPKGEGYEVAVNYSHKDGIISDEFGKKNTIFEDKDHKIYFGMVNGITVYDPDEELKSRAAPKCNISGVLVNDSVYSTDEYAELDLSYNENKLSFNCEGLSYINEDEVKFEYYLSDIEKAWSNVTTDPTISFGYLVPGKYTFYVRVVSKLGIVSEPKSFRFIIHSPFWTQIWFIFSTMVLLIFTGYYVNHTRQAHIRKRNQLLERIVREKTKDLEDHKSRLEIQNQNLIEAQKELVEKRELEKAHEEIKLLKDRLVKENIYLREKQGEIQEVSSIIGRSPVINEIRRKIIEIGKTDSTVLITGETGVGKNLIAEAIHNASSRKDRALITVNCAAIPEPLVESELFGYEKGAFTGANGPHIGKFEVADGSTIFLDEIGDMNLNVQAKVLNVIQSRRLIRIGSTKEKNLDVRIIAATNQNLMERVAQGRFRRDLYYRINVYSILVPPLREYPEDIEPIAKYFIDRYSKLLDKKITAITKSALQILKNHNYPGNIRELENIIHRAVIICHSNVISDQDIMLQSSGSIKNDDTNYLTENELSLEEMEKRYIIHVLTKTKGKISGKEGAAELLGINPSTLRSRMKKLNIPFSS